MGYYPQGYQHKSCELCKHCGGWLVRTYTNAPGTYEVFVCGKPGDRRAVATPETGCSMWVEAPEVALGFYDVITA